MARQMTRDKALSLLRAHSTELLALGVVSLSLFGSVARDEAGPDSDVDLLVEFDPAAHVGLFRFFEVKDYLESVLGCGVDLVPRNGLKPRLRPIVEREEIPCRVITVCSWTIWSPVAKRP